MWFVSMMTISEETISQGKKHYKKEKGKKRAVVVVASMGVETQPYTPV